MEWFWESLVGVVVVCLVAGISLLWRWRIFEMGAEQERERQAQRLLSPELQRAIEEGEAKSSPARRFLDRLLTANYPWRH